MTSKSHALKDNNPPMTEGQVLLAKRSGRGMTEGAGVALDKERKDAPQKKEEKQVGKKTSSRRKKKSKTKKSE